MSNVNDYPTQSQIEQQCKKNDDVIVLNIHNKKINDYIEDSSSLENETNANLKLDNKYNNNFIDQTPSYNNTNNINNNVVFFDNTRQIPYPYSEYRAKIIYDKPSNKNKFSKSFNPNNLDDLSRKEREKMNIKPDVQNQYQLSKEKIITQPKVNFKPEKKKTKIFSFKNICLFIVLTAIFPVFGILYCCFIISKRNSENQNANENE